MHAYVCEGGETLPHAQCEHKPGAQATSMTRQCLYSALECKDLMRVATKDFPHWQNMHITGCPERLFQLLRTDTLSLQATLLRHVLHFDDPSRGLHNYHGRQKLTA